MPPDDCQAPGSPGVSGRAPPSEFAQCLSHTGRHSPYGCKVVKTRASSPGPQIKRQGHPLAGLTLAVCAAGVSSSLGPRASVSSQRCHQDAWDSSARWRVRPLAESLQRPTLSGRGPPQHGVGVCSPLE